MVRLGSALVLIASFSIGALRAQGLDLSFLQPLHQTLYTCSGEACIAISDSLASALERTLEAPESKGLDIIPPDFMAYVASVDDRLQVLTWNWAHEDRTSGYGGLIAFREGREDAFQFTRLLDLSSMDAPDPQRNYGIEDWCGALYYDMVPDAVDKDTWFLLGWDDADALVTRKSIEPIQVRPRGVRFGAPLLQSERGLVRRWVLEFADAVQVSLRHQTASKGKSGQPERIIFDHLAPNEPHLTGITAYYGPDMTFDAFVRGRKWGSPWLLTEGIEAIQAMPTDRPFNDPRPRNGRRNRR